MRTGYSSSQQEAHLPFQRKMMFIIQSLSILNGHPQDWDETLIREVINPVLLSRSPWLNRFQNMCGTIWRWMLEELMKMDMKRWSIIHHIWAEEVGHGVVWHVDSWMEFIWEIIMTLFLEHPSVQVTNRDENEMYETDWRNTSMHESWICV